MEETLPSYVYDELSPEERADYEAHLAGCERCRSLLEGSQRLHEVLNQRPEAEVTPELVVRCRQALDEALDREQLGWRALFRNWSPMGFGSRAPASGAVAAVALILFGFGLGWSLRRRTPEPMPLSTKPATAGVTGADLGNLKIKDISQVAPDPKTGEVRITVNAERRVTMEGSLDDPHIRELLVGAVKGYENAGIRRDALDALRTKSDQPAVRDALLYAMLNDPNPGDRLDALRAVENMEWGNDLHQALLSAAQRDKNPGVRFAAIDTLIERAVKDQDKTLVPTLQRLATNDPNQYVRLKCAEAIHEVPGDQQ